MRQWIVPLSILLSLSHTSLSWSSEDVRCPDGDTPEIIALGQLYDADTGTRKAVLYQCALGPRYHHQYLVILAPDKQPSNILWVGRTGIQTFEQLSLQERKEFDLITLRGKASSANDPVCCPSRDVSLHFAFLGEDLMPYAYCTGALKQTRGTSEFPRKPASGEELPILETEDIIIVDPFEGEMAPANEYTE